MNWSPAWPSLNLARNETAIPSVTMLPAAVTRPIAGRGSCEATSEIASGSQIRIESVISRARDQEIERYAEHADHHQRRVVTEESGLGPAHGRRARAHDPNGAASNAAPDHHPLEHRLGDPAEPQGWSHDQVVDQLVEVPLVDEE